MNSTRGPTGRHSTKPTTECVRVSIFLDAQSRDVLKRLGGGNLSRGVRLAAKWVEEKQ
jgi:hypothetical protein